MSQKPYTILVTGANGQLGSELRALVSDDALMKTIFLDRSQLDFARLDDAFDASLSNYKNIKYIINCAAHTAVDKAESEAELARTINSLAPARLSHFCQQNGARMIHISTDYVYHTQQNTPFCEDDAVAPKGVYARTKLAGEQAVLETQPQAIILRTSWVYTSFGQNFVKTMLRLGSQRPQLGVVSDQIGSPTYARDLASTILKMLRQIENGRDIAGGVYNYSNEGVASWYDFAQAIFEIKGIDCRLLPIKTSDYPTPAERPPFSLMDKTKIKNAVNELVIPHWRESLQQCLSLL